MDYLELIGALVVKVNNVGIMKSNGSFIPPRQKGVSDLIICYKGRFIAIEVKIPGNKPTPFQLAFIEQVKSAGGIGEVMYSFDELKSYIDKLNA